MKAALDAPIDIFPWDDNFNTGLDLIDEQHRTLVYLLNTLASHVAFEMSSPSLSDVFDDLASYAVYHFETEEAIWKEYLADDPLEQGHLEVHASFVGQVSSFRDRLTSHNQGDLATEALGFLARWLASHILEADRLMAYTVMAIRQGYALEEAKVYAREQMGGATRSLIDIILSIYASLSSNTLRLMRELFIHRQRDIELVHERDFSQTILSTLVDGVAVCHAIEAEPFIRFTVWNPAMESLTGYSLEEVNRLGWHQTVYVDPELQKRARERMARMREGDHLDGEEWIITRKNGEARTVTIHTRAVVAPGTNQPQVLAVFRDVTERKLAEEQLKRAARVFEYANEGITITDPEGSILDVNAAFTRITGYTRDEAIGQNPRILKSGRHDRSFYASLWQSLLADGSWKGEIWNRRKNGEVYPELLTIGAIPGRDQEIQGYVALFSDISSQKAHQSQLEHIAHHDSLTGLPNRVLLADRLKQAMVQSQRRGEQLAVMYLDLDGFKAVNDAHGHDVGDELLMRVAERMRRALREGDTLARLGGDEFVGVLVDLTDTSACLHMLDRILESIAQPYPGPDGTVLQISASIGVSFFPQAESMDADQLLRQADQAMYQAKLAGKNRYHVFDALRDRELRGRHETQERIRLAMQQGEFMLYYQPKVNMRSGSVAGVEALLRWKHPERGVLLPGVFLPTLENHSLMVELGDWVIETALEQLTRWRSEGMALKLSVNVDSAQLAKPDFASKLSAALDRHPMLRPGDLELEILETSMLNDIARVTEVLQQAQSMGVRVSLDDFGTGYSSLTYLKRLPAELLKIDQSFVRDMLDDPEDLAILDGVIALARAFRRGVIAEGVETQAHGRMLLQLGCELAQGYAIARPMPPEQIPVWLVDWTPCAEWTTVRSIPHGMLAVLFAVVEHRAWVWKVQRFLTDNSALQPPGAHQCHFGKWLAGASGLGFGYADYERLMRLHALAHAKADELIQLKLQGRNDEALSAFHAIEALRDTLIDELEALIA